MNNLLLLIDLQENFINDNMKKCSKYHKEAYR